MRHRVRLSQLERLWPAAAAAALKGCAESLPGAVSYEVEGECYQAALRLATQGMRRGLDPCLTSGRPDAAAELAERSRRRLQESGPALWAELHWWALSFRGTPAERDAWLKAFELLVPRNACGCRAGWQKIVAAHPPPDDPAALFAWTVDRHNDVNAKLEKPRFGQADAMKRWGGAGEGEGEGETGTRPDAQTSGTDRGPFEGPSIDR